MTEEKNKVVKKGEIETFMQEGMIGSLIEGVLPKVIPLISPALDKFTEYLGEDNKTIVIRRRKDKPPLVIIFDNSKEFQVNGEGITGQDKTAVLGMYDIKQFIEQLIKGDINL